jgi:amino acid adenylation domain-containing protein
MMLREKNDDILLLTSSRYIKQKEYWINKLSGDIARTGIPLAGKRSTKSGEAVKQIEMDIPSKSSNQLNHLSYGNALTIYVILLAGLKALIYRYTGNKDVTVVSPVYQPEMPGKIMNDVLFIRDTVAGGMSFKELLLAVRESVLKAYENQDYPSGKLMEYLENNSLVNTGEITDIVCLLKNIHDPNHVKNLKAGLIFLLISREDLVKGHLLYNPDIYSEGFAQQVASHYVTLLEIVTKDVNTKISDICFLSKEEKQRLVFTFNNNRAEFSRDKTIHQLFEKYAESTPDQVAIAFERSQLTYKELNEQANRLARRLRSSGPQKDRLVGILLNRSIQMVTAIMAVWKTGGSYIPIDCDYPDVRIIRILNDSGTGVLVTGSEYVDTRLEQSFEGTIIQLKKYDPPEEDMTSLEKANLDFDIDMNSLAYVIYTSGSTGKPKGAMVEHMGMMNHIQAKINDLQLTDKSIVAQNASHTFDISVWQFFAALTVGGKTIIYSHELILEPANFFTLLNQHQVTVLEVVPSYLSIMLDILNGESRTVSLPLAYLLVTGEEVKPSLVKRWFEMYPRVKMVNAYGPTEASDDITHYVMEKKPDIEKIHLGKPLQNLNIYIADREMNLCPVGVVGEICVSGVGVGRGYINDKNRTKDVFMEDPFGGVRGIRLYKTGDLGCWSADGTVGYLGRKDYQVKIRGIRIELGEIESVLLAIGGVKEAIVTDKDDGQGNKYLCAYLVPLKKIDISEVKDFLSAHLPDYMVPTHFVELDKLPLTLNGKIDREALPKPVIGSPSAMPYVTAEMLKQVPAKPDRKHEKKERVQQESWEKKILPEEERYRLLYIFNDTKAEYPEEKLLHQLFEDQVEKRSNNTAIAYNGEKLTYSQLNKKANQLARLLRCKGVQPDHVVGILTSPSLELMTALLAVVKAGGGYMPIEPEYPEERIKFMLMDSHTPVLLTQRHLTDKVSYQGDVITLNDPEVYRGEDSNLEHINAPLDVLHMLYTSGTTGKPKGVLISHQNLVNYTTWFLDAIHITSQDKTLLNSSFAYDLCYSSLYSSILAGGELHVLPVKVYQDPVRMIDYIRDNKITFIKLTPSHYSIIINSPYFTPDVFGTIRLVVSCGEEIKPKDIEKTHKLCSHIEVMNHYGPSECTTGSITQFMDFQTFEEYKKSPTIGKPVYNTRAYILDKDLELVPIGEVGELCISGDGMSRGYTNHPGLTKEKFVPNPYQASKRLYRTGDFARWLPNGNIEFLGRMDHQVKIKGYRIELSEIENQLLNDNDIKEAVVMVRESADKDKYLCAFVVAGKTLIESGVRAFMAQELPFYMIPSYFVQLEKMPLNPNGKIDRTILQALDIESLKNTEFEPPANESEEVLVEIWANVLGIEKGKIGVNHDFFKLGGDSLKAIKLVAAASRENIHFNFTELFLHPTIRELAKNLKFTKKKIPQEEVSGEILLLPLQKRVFLRNNPHPEFWNVIFLRDIVDDVNLAILEKSIDKLIEHHDALRINFINKDGTWKQINRKYKDVRFHLRTVKLDRIDPQKQQPEIRDYISRLHCSLDLEKDLLIRAVVFDFGRAGKKLFISIHHFICDLVSIYIFLEDLEETYFKYIQGAEIKLNSKTTSFMEWSNKLHFQLKPGQLDLSYWQNLDLDGIDYLTDQKVKGISISNIATSLSTFEKEDTKALKTVAAVKYDASIEEVLLSALVISLHEISNLNNILIELESHGRAELFEDVDLSRSIGWFTNAAPLVLAYKGDIKHTIENTKKTLRSLPHRGIFYNIARYIFNQDVPHLSLQIGFNYQGEPLLQSDSHDKPGALFKTVSSDSLKSAETPFSPKDLVLLIHPDNYFSYILFFAPVIFDSQIQLIFSFSPEYVKPEIINSLPGTYINTLKRMIGI